MYLEERDALNEIKKEELLKLCNSLIQNEGFVRMVGINNFPVQVVSAAIGIRRLIEGECK